MEKADFKSVEFVRHNVKNRQAEVKNVSLFTLNESRYFFLAQTYKHLCFRYNFYYPIRRQSFMMENLSDYFGISAGPPIPHSPQCL